MAQKNSCITPSTFLKEKDTPQYNTYSRNGFFYVEIYFGEERIRKSLKTNDPKEAARMAPIAAVEELDRRMGRIRPLISELFNVYTGNRLVTKKQANERTKGNNVNRMKHILAEYDIDVGAHDIGMFAKKTGNGTPICEDYLIRHGEKGANNMRQARSIFSKGWITYYKRMGIDTTWFANWIALTVESTEVQAFIPMGSERDRIVEKCEALKTIDVELYKAYALAYGLGLRSSEILRAKYDDLFDDMNGNKLIRIHNPKSGGKYQDRCCDPYWWNEVLSLRGNDEYIIEASKDRIVRDFPYFLRHECGVSDNRPVHRLRKYAGDRTMRTNGNSIYAASKVLGHKSIEMTAKIYSGLPTIVASR